MLEIKRGILNAEIFNNLTESVGWGHPSIEQVEMAIKNSLYNACIMDGEEVIAMGRIFGDNSMSYYLKDVVVKPSHQGKGVGRLLINDMLSFIKENTPKGWKVSVELMSALGKDGFYKKLGFESRPNEISGAGMFMRISNA